MIRDSLPLRQAVIGRREIVQNNRHFVCGSELWSRRQRALESSGGRAHLRP